MLSKTFAVALALSSAASAAPALRARQSDHCQADYENCLAAGTLEVVCTCTLSACFGEDNLRNREFCASATANLPKPTSSSIPGGCNPAHPGSCPDSYFSTTAPVPTPTFSSIYGIPGGCNPAHPGSCPTPASSFVTSAKSAEVTFSSISGIPGGCNPAHPGSCPDSYFSTTAQAPKPTFSSISGIPGGCNPAHPGSCPTPSPKAPAASPSAPAASPTVPSIPGGCNPAHPGSCPTPSAAPAPVAAAPGSNPVLVAGKTWTISDLIRYCGEDNSGCDYNFAIEANGKTQRCTVIRNPGSNAASESWSNQPCTDGSDLTVSWGYVAEPAPAYAVVTVNQGAELAWFGVSNINEGKVTPSSPFGSGHYGTLPAAPVYTYKN